MDNIDCKLVLVVLGGSQDMFPMAEQTPSFPQSAYSWLLHIFSQAGEVDKSGISATASTIA